MGVSMRILKTYIRIIRNLIRYRGFSYSIRYTIYLIREAIISLL